MNHIERGRGTVFSSISNREENNPEESREKELIQGESETASSPVPRPFFLTQKQFERREAEAYAALAPRGKPTSARAHLRYMATSRPAIQLDREMRCAAAADPALVWDPQTFRYRRVRKAPSAPSPPPLQHGGGAAGGGGGAESSDGHVLRTGAGQKQKRKPDFSLGDDDGRRD
jgi:hypothetical protein